MTFKKYRVALLVLAAVTLTAMQPADALKGSAQRRAETLHERAKRAGGKLTLLHKPDNGVVYPSLEALAGLSDLIVVGHPVANRGRLSPDGMSLTLDYRFRVQGVVKGNLRAGATITVSLPGGAHRFPDGAVVYVGPTNYKQAENGRLYAIFLKVTGKGYAPVAETQALFDLTGGTVQPADRVATNPIAAKFRGSNAAAFLRELRGVTSSRKN